MESIRMFSLCANMKWNHLPVEGGIYAQHPRLLEDFEYIFARSNEYQRQKAEAEKRKAKTKGKK